MQRERTRKKRKNSKILIQEKKTLYIQSSLHISPETGTLTLCHCTTWIYTISKVINPGISERTQPTEDCIHKASATRAIPRDSTVPSRTSTLNSVVHDYSISPRRRSARVPFSWSVCRPWGRKAVRLNGISRKRDGEKSMKL